MYKRTCWAASFVFHVLVAVAVVVCRRWTANACFLALIGFIFHYCLYGILILIIELILLCIQLTISFLIGRKCSMNFRNQRLGRHLPVDFTITCQGHSRSWVTCHVRPRCVISKGSHVNFARFVLLAVSGKTKTWLSGLLFWPAWLRKNSSISLFTTVAFSSVKLNYGYLLSKPAFIQFFTYCQINA